MSTSGDIATVWTRRGRITILLRVDASPFLPGVRPAYAQSLVCVRTFDGGVHGCSSEHAP